MRTVFSHLVFYLFLSYVSARPIDGDDSLTSDSSTVLPETSSSFATLALSRQLNFNEGGLYNLHQHDLRRAWALLGQGGSAIGSPPSTIILVDTPAENQVVSYIAKVGVGSPVVEYSLIIDTGSSNTWIGANQSYVPSSSSRQTPDSVSVHYGSGSFSGVQFIDTIDMGNGLIIPNQSIGVANSTTGFTGIDGILGIGPTNITLGTLSPSSDTVIPTVTDNLFNAGLIQSDSIAISFTPTSNTNVTGQLNGEMTWGDLDSSKYNGNVTYVPITSSSPANRFWGINQAVTYGQNKGPILSLNAGILDTGTTLTLLATDAFNAYLSATGATPDPTTGLLIIDQSGYDRLESLFFDIGNATFEFTRNAQTWPRALNSAIGGNPDSIYLIIGDLGKQSGSGLDFINGQSWLERFYSVYDTSNIRVGVAETPFTFAETN